MARKPRAVPPIPEEPMIPDRYSEPEKVAYRDGWRVAHNKLPRHNRPNYLTHDEREAFNDGWDFRTKFFADDCDFL
jgi:hypothetical protein